MNITHVSRAFGYCPVHGKMLYLTRKDAKGAARKQHPTTHKSPYTCSDQPQLWHYGTVPPAVLAGRMTRAEVYG